MPYPEPPETLSPPAATLFCRLLTARPAEDWTDADAWALEELVTLDGRAGEAWARADLADKACPHLALYLSLKKLAGAKSRELRIHNRALHVKAADAKEEAMRATYHVMDQNPDLG